MKQISTVTTKGQVVIPAHIRKSLNIGPSSKMSILQEGDSIIMKKILNLDDLYGTIKTDKPLSKKEMRKIIGNAIVDKYYQ